MEYSIFLGKAWGLYFLIIGLVFLLKPRNIHAILNMTGKPIFNLFVGYSALFIGVFTIAAHNNWELGWSLIITIIGWVAIIKGIFFIANPNFVFKPSRISGINLLNLENKYTVLIMSIANMGLGLFLLYKSCELAKILP